MGMKESVAALRQMGIPERGHEWDPQVYRKHRVEEDRLMAADSTLIPGTREGYNKGIGRMEMWHYLRKPDGTVVYAWEVSNPCPPFCDGMELVYA